MDCNNSGQMEQIPAIVPTHLDSISHNDGGGLLLAASSLTTRYWNGSLWYFENPDDAPNVEKCTAGIEVESGVVDACWIQGTDRVLCACDSGAVLLWQLDVEHHSFRCLARKAEHDDLITTVNVNADRTKATSASVDNTIKVWNLEELTSENTYRAHSDTVWGGVWHPSDPCVFISSSQDGKLLLWDIRKAKPASIIDTAFLQSLPTCVAWQPSTDNTVAVGTESGHVLLEDIRKGVGKTLKVKAHSRTVHRIAFAPHKPSWLATASEDCTATVVDFTDDTAQVCFRNASHQDFVQGISWSPRDQRLFTCSWDFTVNGHSIDPSLKNSVPMESDVSNTDISAANMDTAPISQEGATNGTDNISSKPTYSEKLKQTPVGVN